MTPKMIIFLMVIIRTIIAILFYVLCFISSYKVKRRNKLVAFECGFAGMGAITRRFSVHFFMLVLIFILFEMEILLLVGCLYALGLYSFLAVMLFILGGMYLEYRLGKLRWMV